MTTSAAAARMALMRVASRRIPPALGTLQYKDKRWFSRKGAKMGHHLETLDELAHRESHEKAKERRNAKKLHKKQQKEAHSSEETLVVTEDEHPEEVEFDEGDDVFHHGDEDEAPELPHVDEVKKRMMKVVKRLTDSFKAIRGNEPTPEIFDPITVQAYGERTPLNAVAQVVITSPTLVTITCFDPSVAPEVRNAIQLAMELSPQLEEDGVILVKMPRPTMESRQKTVKLLGKQAESGRQRIRGIRRAAMDIVSKGKQGKLEGISKDDAFRVSKEIDAVTDEVVKLLNDEVEAKQESVMAV
jgi:ribosome recycling factor